MTDTEKVDLIDSIIADFWEHSSEEKISKGAEAVVVAIAAVVNFERNNNER